MCVMANAENPVLAHLYLDYLLDLQVAEQNFTWNAYLPALDRARRRLPDRQGLRAREPAQRGADHRADRQGPALPAAGARRRAGLGGHLVEVHGRWLIGRRDRPRARPRQPGLLGVCSRCPGVAWLVAFFVVPVYAVLAAAFGADRSAPAHPAARVEPAAVGLRHASARSSTASSATTSAASSSARRGCSVRSARALAAGCCLIGYPVALLRGPQGEPVARRAAGSAGAAVLDQLPDAHAGVGQPAADRRLRQPGAAVAAPHRTSRATGSTATGRPWSSA